LAILAKYFVWNREDKMGYRRGKVVTQLWDNVACVTILTLWPTMSCLKKKVTNKKMQLNHANFIFFLVCRQIFESLIENWNIIWPQYFKRNCSSDSLKILSDEFMQEPPRWGLWSGDYAYIDSSRIYMYLSGTLGLHTLFFFYLKRF